VNFPTPLSFNALARREPFEFLAQLFLLPRLESLGYPSVRRSRLRNLSLQQHGFLSWSSCFLWDRRDSNWSPWACCQVMLTIGRPSTASCVTTKNKRQLTDDWNKPAILYLVGEYRHAFDLKDIGWHTTDSRPVPTGSSNCQCTWVYEHAAAAAASAFILCISKRAWQGCSFLSVYSYNYYFCLLSIYYQSTLVWASHAVFAFYFNRPWRTVRTSDLMPWIPWSWSWRSCSKPIVLKRSAQVHNLASS